TNILVAIGGSEQSNKPFNKAIEIAKKHGAKLTLAHVIELYPSYYITFDEEAVLRNGREVLKKFEDVAKEHGLEVEGIVHIGKPKQVIPRELAETLKVDLIVCGAHEGIGLEHFLLGSVSESIA